MFAALLQGCAKDGYVISPAPVPAATPTPSLIIPIRPVANETPFQAFVTKYNVPLTDNSESLGLTTAALATETRTGTLYTAAELGFVFRSSVAGTIFELGTLLPATGFAHTVTLWDSATQAVLATINVTSQSGSVFTYAGLRATVPIQANHSYVVGFNSLAVGLPVNTFSTANEVYLVNGIWTGGGGGPYLPLVPFAEGNITVENAFYANYGYGAPPTNLFPTAASWNTEPHGFFGLCDIGFAPNDIRVVGL